MMQALSPLVIHRYDELDSTSSEAQRLMSTASGPFAVVAKRQTQGRGRLGKDWQSPDGNLYLSLAFSDTNIVDPKSPLSLRVGLALAMWLDERFGIQTSLKWPNDLLWGASKLAGILVEASSQGQSQNVVIGIGLNMTVTPQLVDQAAISLRQILPNEDFSDLDGLAAECALAVYSHLQRDDWRQAYQQFLIPRGQPFVYQEGFYSADGLDPDGSLRLKPWSASGDTKVLASAVPSSRWLYQDFSLGLAVLDAGNTNCKLHFFENSAQIAQGGRSWSFGYQADATKEPLHELRQCFAAQGKNQAFPYPIWMASVNNPGLAQITDTFSKAGFRLMPLTKRRMRVDFSAYDFEQMGMDRLALTEAVAALYPGENILLVSCGTAHTIEAIDRYRVYRGGWILPGIALKLNSLAEHTAALPKISEGELWQYFSFNDQLGHQTKEAMIRSAIWEAVAGIRSLLDYLAEQTSEPWRCLVTGGAGFWLANIIDAEIDERLLGRGLAMMVLGGLAMPQV